MFADWCELLPSPRVRATLFSNHLASILNRAKSKIPTNLNPIMGHHTAIGTIRRRRLLVRVTFDRKNHSVRTRGLFASVKDRALKERELPQLLAVAGAGEDELLVVAELVRVAADVEVLGGLVDALLDGGFGLGTAVEVGRAGDELALGREVGDVAGEEGIRLLDAGAARVVWVRARPMRTERVESRIFKVAKRECIARGRWLNFIIKRIMRMVWLGIVITFISFSTGLSRHRSASSQRKVVIFSGFFCSVVQLSVVFYS